MMYTLNFAAAHDYDTREPGISLPVKLLAGTEAASFEAKVDTGASLCIFERQQGERLGIEIESGTPQSVGTVTGRFLTYGHEVRLCVLGIEVVTTVYFAADPQFTRNVLGRQGWLDRLRVGLVDYDGRLYLSAYDDAA